MALASFAGPSLTVTSLTVGVRARRMIPQCRRRVGVQTGAVRDEDVVAGCVDGNEGRRGGGRVAHRGREESEASWLLVLGFYASDIKICFARCRRWSMCCEERGYELCSKAG